MIVQCTECMTRFNLDETRLRGDSAKVRCSKCRHVFMIQKKSDDADTGVPVPGIDRLDDAFTFDPLSNRDESSLPDINADFQAPYSQAEESFDIFTTEQSAPASPLDRDQGMEPASGREEPPFHTPLDDDIFSFADVAPPDEPPETEHTRSAHPQREEVESFDFVFPEEPQQETPPPLEFDHLDFGAPPAAGSAELSAPTTESAPSPPATEISAEPEPEIQAPVVEAPPSKWGEYRPFIIAGLSTVALTMALTVGYFAFKGKPGDHNRLGIQNLKTPGEEEQGSFTIKSTEAFYVKNRMEGELFVIKASAVNNYKTPRIGIEAQASLLDKSGKLLQKVQAFCNSEVSEEDLATLSYQEITEKLSQGPSDDPLENTPIEPGKAAACLIVFRDVPKDAAEYGIEIIHSQSEKIEEF